MKRLGRTVKISLDFVSGLFPGRPDASSEQNAPVPSEVMPIARIEAQTALAKEPKLASAHGVIGLISLVYDYDWRAAERRLMYALELNPNETATLLSYAH